MILKLIARLPERSAGLPLSITLDRTGPCSAEFALGLEAALRRLSGSGERGSLLRLLGLVVSVPYGPRSFRCLDSCETRLLEQSNRNPTAILVGLRPGRRRDPAAARKRERQARNLAYLAADTRSLRRVAMIGS